MYLNGLLFWTHYNNFTYSLNQLKNASTARKPTTRFDESEHQLAYGEDVVKEGCVQLPHTGV